MKYNTIARGTLSLLLMLCSTFVGAQDADLIIGQWKDTDHPEKAVTISRQGNAYTGKSILPEGQPSTAAILIFKDLYWVEREGVYHGILIDPDGKDEYEIKIRMTDKDRFQFSVSKFFLKKTFQFNRIR